jgi:hypothetical protein
LANGDLDHAPAPAATPPAAPPSPAPYTPPPTPAAPAPAQVPAPVNGNGKTAEVRLAHYAKAYLRCIDAAVYVKVEYERKHGVSMTPDQFQACTSTLFIAGQKDNLF